MKNIEYCYLKFHLSDSTGVINEIRSIKFPQNSDKVIQILKNSPYFYIKKNLKLTVLVEKVSIKEGEIVEGVSSGYTISPYQWVFSSIIRKCIIQ